MLSFGSDFKLTVQAVTPGITAQEYAHRRSRLANRLPKNSIAILAAADVKYRASGVFYEYRQDSNFFYLTGKRIQFSRGNWVIIKLSLG